MEVSVDSHSAGPKGRVGRGLGRGLRNGEPRGARAPRQEELPYKNKIDEESRAIDALQAELASINKLIAEHTGTSVQGGNEERQQLKKTLDDIQAKMDELERRKTKCIEALEGRQKEQRDKHKALSDLKASLGYKSEREIDIQIQILEQRMMTSSVSLKEEKAMLAQIQQLRATRASLEPLRQLEQSAAKTTESEYERKLRLELDAIRDQLSSLRVAKREQGQRLYSLNESKKKTFATINSYFDKRNEVTGKIRQHLQNRQRIAKELEVLNNEYYAKQQQLHQQRVAQQQLERKRKSLQVEIKRLQRQLEDSSFLPHDADIRLLQQVSIYIDKLGSSNTFGAGNVDDENQGHGTSAQKPAINQELESQIQGRVIAPKDNSAVFLVAPKVRRDKTKARSNQGAKPLKLDVATISYFEYLGIKAPTSLDTLPQTKQLVLEKLEHYQRVQAECDVASLRKEIEDKLAEAQQRLDALDEQGGKGAKENGPVKASEVGEAAAQQAEAQGGDVQNSAANSQKGAVDKDDANVDAIAADS